MCDVGCGAAAGCGSLTAVSQFGSTSTQMPKLLYQPQLRQIVTTPDFIGAAHFSQQGPAHSAAPVSTSVVSTGSSVASASAEADFNSSSSERSSRYSTDDCDMATHLDWSPTREQ